MNFIKFLGTAGARFVMIKQLRASGGIWLRYGPTNIMIDPGPGALVRCKASRPSLDPGILDAIIITHKHLDHAADINVMIEAMTEGGFKKKGVVFAPADALGPDGVVFSYLESFPQSIITLKEGVFSVGKISFEVPLQNIHSVPTYGLKFSLGPDRISFISDTRYSDQLLRAYDGSTLLILNVVFAERRSQFEHLCLDDAVYLIRHIRPKKAILTHFGMTMLKAKPYNIEKRLRQELGLDIACAYDGYSVTLPLP